MFSGIVARHGIVVGYHVNKLFKFVDDTGKLTGYRIEAELNHPAYVAARVFGTPPDAMHAVYYDGEKLWGPH